MIPLYSSCGADVCCSISTYFLLRYSNTRLKQRMRFCCNAVMYFRRFFRDVERDEYNSCRGNLIINVNASTVQRVTAGMACQPAIQAKPTYSSDLIYTPDTSKAAVVSGESWSPSSPAHTMNYWTVRRPALSTHICHTSAVWSVFRPEKIQAATERGLTVRICSQHMN